MLSLYSSGPRHTCECVLALLLTLVACSDDGPTAPVVPVPSTPSELAGVWSLSDSSVTATAVEETHCRNRGIVTFSTSQTGIGVDVRIVGTCISPRGPGTVTSAMEGTAVTIIADSIAFSVASTGFFGETCSYTGRLTGGSALGASGTVSCSRGRKGTWHMSWGTPEPTAMGKLTMVEIGGGLSCALDVSGQAWCWGSNSYGDLGTGDDLPRLVPTAVSGGIKFTQISVADYGPATCGLTGTGQAYCWGGSYGGRLGDGSGAEAPRAVTSPQPVVGGHSFKQIAAAVTHACAITTTGAAYCWGINSKGELGNGSNTPSSTPIAVSGGLAFRQIDAVSAITCGVTTSGDAYCWGYGEYGRLGNDETSDSNVPVLVKGGLKFVSVSVGSESACGVTIEGDGYCWGSDWGVGNLGTGTNEEFQSTPARVTGGMKWKSIRVGSYVACGVTVSNVGYCWGDNFQGVFGAGPNVRQGSNTPVAITGGLAFDHVVVDWHGCGLTVTGVAYCWSEGLYGQIGDGNLRLRWVPTRVAGQQ